MSVLTGISPILMTMQESLHVVWDSVAGVLGTRPVSNIEVPLKDTPGIDPRFIPRVPMKADNIDVHLLSELGKMGLKRGKEITAQTHPEFYAEWMRICGNAQLNPPPQLILCESKMANAYTLPSRQEAVVTTGLLKKLTMREAVGILGHELGHATSDHTTPRVQAGLLLGVPSAAMGAYFAHNGGFAKFIKQDVPSPSTLRRSAAWLAGRSNSTIAFLGLTTYAWIGALSGVTASKHFSVRSTELDADRKGVLISEDAAGFISALSKLEATFDKKPVARALAYLFSGYPTTNYRIKQINKFHVSNSKFNTNLHSLETPIIPTTLTTDIRYESALNEKKSEQINLMAR